MSITRYFDPKTAEEMRLRHGIVRKSGISRSIDYKRQFAEWKKSEKGGLGLLRLAFEHSLLNDGRCKWNNLGHLCHLVYEPESAANTSETLFLLDALKEKACKSHYGLLKAESWKALDPEQGVEVHQRYLLRPKSANWFLALFKRWQRADLLVVEAVYIEQIHTRLELRLYPAPRKAQIKSIPALMELLLKD